LKCISGNYSIAGNRGHLACFRRYLIELELELELFTGINLDSDFVRRSARPR